jgi:peptidyl-prolyl cis-trans isomerase D
LKLQIKSASGVTRRGAPALIGLTSPKFLQALFDEKNRQNGRNTEAVEAGPNRLIAAHLTKYFPASKRPFSEVKAQIRDQWTMQTAVSLAKQDAETQLAAWKAKPDSATALSSPVVVSRAGVRTQPAQIIEAVMRAKFDKLPAWTVADMGGAGWAVVRINSILPPEISDQERAGAANQYGQMWAAAEIHAYSEALRKRYKARVTSAGSAVVAGKGQEP